MRACACVGACACMSAWVDGWMCMCVCVCVYVRVYVLLHVSLDPCYNQFFLPPSLSDTNAQVITHTQVASALRAKWARVTLATQHPTLAAFYATLSIINSKVM